MPFITKGRHLFDVDLGLTNIGEVLSDLSDKRFTGKTYGYAETDNGIIGFTILFRDGAIVAAELISESKERILGREAVERLVKARIRSGIMGVREASLPEIEIDLAFNPEAVIKEVDLPSLKNPSTGKTGYNGSVEPVREAGESWSIEDKNEAAEIEIEKAEKIERKWRIKIKLKYGKVKEYTGTHKIPEYLLFIDELWKFEKTDIKDMRKNSNLCDSEICLARLINGGSKLLILKGQELVGFFEKRGFKYVPTRPDGTLSPSGIEVASPDPEEFNGLLDLCHIIREEELPYLLEIKIMVNTKKTTNYVLTVKDIAKLLIKNRRKPFLIKLATHKTIIAAGDGGHVYLPMGVDYIYKMSYPVKIDLYLPKPP